MEQTVNKDQDPPHGGSWLRQADGSLVLNEGPQPEGAQAQSPAAGAAPAPQPPAQE